MGDGMKKIITIILIGSFHFSSFICLAQYTKLLDFSGPSNGSHPDGSLFYDGTYLYGTTSDGGA